MLRQSPSVCAVSEDSWHPLPEGITHENGHGDVAIALRPAVGSDPTEGRSGEQNQREERHEKRDKMCPQDHANDRNRNGKRGEAPPWNAQPAGAHYHEQGDG